MSLLPYIWSKSNFLSNKIKLGMVILSPSKPGASGAPPALHPLSNKTGTHRTIFLVHPFFTTTTSGSHSRSFPMDVFQFPFEVGHRKQADCPVGRPSNKTNFWEPQILSLHQEPKPLSYCLSIGFGCLIQNRGLSLSHYLITVYWVQMSIQNRALSLSQCLITATSLWRKIWTNSLTRLGILIFDFNFWDPIGSRIPALFLIPGIPFGKLF